MGNHPYVHFEKKLFSVYQGAQGRNPFFADVAPVRIPGAESVDAVLVSSTGPITLNILGHYSGEGFNRCKAW